MRKDLRFGNQDDTGASAVFIIEESKIKQARTSVSSLASLWFTAIISSVILYIV